VNRKRLYSITLVIALLVGATVWQVNTQTAQAQSGGGFGSIIFDVIPNPDASNIPSGSGPFYRAGTIYLLGTTGADGATPGTPVGTWRAWGYVQRSATGGTSAAPVIVSNQEFWLTAYNGVIEAQGVTNRTGLLIEGAEGKAAEGLTVTGGLGTFRTTFGEAQMKNFVTGPFSYDRPFRVYIQETSRRPKGQAAQ
jgi:hypothetical protein